MTAGSGCYYTTCNPPILFLVFAIPHKKEIPSLKEAEPNGPVSFTLCNKKSFPITQERSAKDAHSREWKHVAYMRPRSAQSVRLVVYFLVETHYILDYNIMDYTI